MDYSRHNLVGTGPLKSRYQLGWSVLYVNKTTLDVIHFFFFCPQHGKGPPDGLGGNCKNVIRAEEKNRRHLPATIGVFLWLQANFTAVQSPGIGLFSILQFGNVFLD